MEEVIVKERGQLQNTTEKGGGGARWGGGAQGEGRLQVGGGGVCVREDHAGVFVT